MATAGPTADAKWKAECAGCRVVLAHGVTLVASRDLPVIESAVALHTCPQLPVREAGSSIKGRVEIIHVIPAGTIRHGRITED
jgi:hypothetical protein